ncbi:polysaccharide biosynthesis/export family protein [Mucilaginibacter sp. UR6-11]|uniref:polysaccharide biosynthesis/export family protein n=1 Tax=Mucilaginibacter sp. UR6-11 TaxID=1435644 RepID=UPI001E524B07|nr:polysaccharide biosynthesis/export family protein [Mucilaginibacter sp. UR6-11]MCC8424849.1 polysaccharide biosynthesis/export family protein [Mucilaginibacter sp. UR6-11]
MQKKTLLNIILLFLFAALSSSCVSKKGIAYFQKESNGLDTINLVKTYVPKIQPGDILTVNISSLSPLASSFFNPFAASSGESSGATSTPQPDVTGFLVDNFGTIELPLIGTVKLAGLTTTQARDTIKNRLKFYLKEPTVNIRFVNYKISVMGEVSKPAVYIIPNERVTLPEALTMAGDLTVFAKRDKILIIRDINGKKEFGTVDLSNREVFTSPYYYLHSGDLIYVEPRKSKLSQTSDVYRILPVALSAASLLLTLYLATKK